MIAAAALRRVLLRPGVLIAAALVAVLAIEEWRISRLRADAADAAAESAKVRAENADLRLAIETQNARIRELQAEASASARRADRAAQDTLYRGRQQRRGIAADQSAGPEALNAWLREVF